MTENENTPNGPKTGPKPLWNIGLILGKRTELKKHTQWASFPP